MRTRLSLLELQAFIHAAEARNFRQAADRSFISQPALTRRIQSAENKLGVRLLDRNTRHVELTEHGRALLPIARRLATQFEAALGDLSDCIAGTQGQVAVASLPSIAAHLLPSAIAEFRANFPHVKLTFKLVDTQALLGLLVAGQVDFALGSPPLEGYDLDFESLPIDDELILVCAIRDPLARLSCVPWSALRERPYIAVGQDSSTAALIAQAFARHQIQVDAAYEVANMAVLGRLVASGIGVAVVSRLALRLMESDGICALALQGERLVRRCGVLRLRPRPLSQAANKFLEALIAAS